VRRLAALALLAVTAALAGLLPATPVAQERAASRPVGATFRDCPSCPEMIALAPGSVAPGEAAGRRVTIGYRLAVSTSRISLREWKACVLANQCPALGAASAASLEPVLQVSWLDVQQYLAWLTLETGAEYRLMSEAEWEYVTRGAAPGAGGLRAEGLEWTSDCWHADRAAAPVDGSSWDSEGDCRYHVARGRRPGEPAATSATRYRFLFDTRDPALGFRVARVLGD
jgi:formylglycine-generating enzyme required for sulfatase activity